MQAQRIDMYWIEKNTTHTCTYIHMRTLKVPEYIPFRRFVWNRKEWKDRNPRIRARQSFYAAARKINRPGDEHFIFLVFAFAEQSNRGMRGATSMSLCMPREYFRQIRRRRRRRIRRW